MYIYNSKKKRKVVHLLNKDKTGTKCKVERFVFSRMDTILNELPDGRRICNICLIWDKNKSDKKSLLKPKTNINFYSSYQWRELRDKALQLYGRKCMSCGADYRDTKICVDHIKPRVKYPELELDINNLQILCDACNHGKGHWDETDHRFSDPDKLESEQYEHMRSIIKIVK